MVSLSQRGAFFIGMSSNEYQIIIKYTFNWNMQIKTTKKYILQSVVSKITIIYIFLSNYLVI